MRCREATQLDVAPCRRPVLVLQETLVELAGGVSGKFLAEVDRARALHVGELAAAVGDEFLSERFCFRSRCQRGRQQPDAFLFFVV